MRRRSLIGLLPALSLSFEAVAQPATTWLPGLQLYTVRDLLRADLDGTLRRVAETGYREVELAGLPGVAAEVMHESVKRHGLAAPSMHASYDELRGDLDAVVKDARTLGAAFIVCPSIEAGDRRTAEDWRKVCQTLGTAGRAVRDRGLALAYHNHDFEFVPFQTGAAPFDLLINETDPRDVKLELDVYWAAKGGRDPVRCLKDNAGRVQLVHLKDMARDGSITELGAGVLDFGQIIRAALAAGVKHLFVEQDDPPDPRRSIAASLRYLEGLPPDVRPRSRL